jgi:hypothetical protein
VQAEFHLGFFAQDKTAFVIFLSLATVIFGLFIDENCFIAWFFEHWRLNLLVDVREYFEGIVNVFLVCFSNIVGFQSAMSVLLGEFARSIGWLSNGRRVVRGVVGVVERSELIRTSTG